MTIANNFEEILLAFNEQKVEYMIAGGYAVIFYGYGRTTGDLDIWVKPTFENRAKIMRALEKLGFPSELTNYLGIIKDFSQPFAIKLGEEPSQVDIFNAITGVSYSDAEKNAVRFRFSEKLECKFIHLHYLITNKMLTGRLKDKADVEELHKINIHSKDKSILAAIKKLSDKK
ncbi:MAG: hypothetical protein WD426_04635 [Anditalea sp.]